MQKHNIQSDKTLKEIIVKQRAIIFALVTIVFGVVFIFLSPPLPSEVRDVGISLIPAGILTAIAELYLRKDFMREFREAQYRYELFAELERLGIKKVYETRRGKDPIFGEIAQIAQKEPQRLKRIRILGISLEPFINVVGSLMDELLQNGCKFEFLSLAANSEVAKKRETEQEMIGVIDRIRSFEKWITKYIEKPEFKENIELRKYNFAPVFHITIINEEKLFVNLYPIFESGWDLPILEIDKNGVLFEKFELQFDKVWNKAKPLKRV
jgi:hypothetical protein